MVQDPVQQVEHAPEESAAGLNNFSCIVEDPDQRFEVPPTADFPVSPLLKEPLQMPQLLRQEAELTADSVTLVLHNGRTQHGACSARPSAHSGDAGGPTMRKSSR